MSDIYQYGSHRCLEPQNSFPNLAWKLDNATDIYDNEILIDVKLLNIDANSFKQIYIECRGDIDAIKRKIIEIVSSRGKLHNPVTGTGGILYGEILKIGKSYANENNLSIGDNIISLSSLTLTPLRIEKITNVDVSSGQIQITGKAILYSHSPLIKAPSDIPINLLLSVMDEAGAAIQSYNLATPGTRVLIIGASGTIGLICAYSIRKKLQNSGCLIGVRSMNGDRAFQTELKDVYDAVYYLDVLKPIQALEALRESETEFDLVINCMNTVGVEMFSILCTRDSGNLYLANLGNNYKTICSTTEGLAKDLNIIAYKGYSKDHADFTINLLRENPSLIKNLNSCLRKNYNKESIGNKINTSELTDSVFLKDINLEEYVFVSPEIQKVLDNALKAANYDCTVLITGESGTGKEIFAKLIHKCSDRNNMPLIKINCGSIPPNLIESELFGYESGAFTGAAKNGKTGFFELASGGTIFLDEIGELPLELQVKLLRVLQEKEIYRIGGIKPIKVDIRVLAATNKNLFEQITLGKFREDLFYRLNVYPIEIPSLRERTKDIIPLVKNFTNKYNQKFKLNKSFDENALNYLVNYNWPGNIRELENFIQRILISIDTNLITTIDVARNLNSYEKTIPISNMDFENCSLEEIINQREFEILKVAKEKYKTTRSIAKALGLSQSTLVRKLGKHHL
jgi:transcriptional regulator with PAS, ATPase and Fis domain